MDSPLPTVLIHKASILGQDGKPKSLEVWLGDVTAPIGLHNPDLLVISAFPEDYTPTDGSVIGRLSHLGINVYAEARSKKYDWRESWNCWVSRPLQGNHIGRLICFEHGWDKRPEHVIGNIFRTVREMVIIEHSEESTRQGMETLRLPLVSTGDQLYPKREVLRAIITQSFLHLAAGLPVQRIQLVLKPKPHDNSLEPLLVELGICLEENRHQWQNDLWRRTQPDQDIFLSYRHQDLELVSPLLQSLKDHRPGLSVFIDHEGLEPGNPWKLELLKAMARCQKTLCIITDTYPDSVECIDEFHAALLQNNRQRGYLLSVLNLRTRRLGDLPESLRSVHHIHSRLPYEPADDLAQRLLPHIPPSRLSNPIQMSNP